MLSDDPTLEEIEAVFANDRFATQGAALTATAVCDKPGRHLGFYTVTVEDDLGKQIAKMTATCYR